MARALVTGTGGYVGGRLVSALTAAGWQVHGISREPVPWLDIETEVLDLTTADRDVLVDACRGAAAVIHLAGENEVTAARRPAAAMASTAVATERTAEAAAEAGVRRFVYMSTVHVYGERIAGGVTLTEEMRPEPRASYAISRLASEHLAAGVAREGFDLVVLRLTNSVGAPYDPSVDRWTLVTNDLCRQGVLDRALELRTSGAQWRDFVALDDVCSIVVAAAAANGALPAGTYNLGSGEPITVRGLAEMVQNTFERLTGDRPELRAPPPEAERSEPYRVSVERLERHGLRASTPLAHAVEETVRFCLAHREELPR